MTFSESELQIIAEEAAIAVELSRVQLKRINRDKSPSALLLEQSGWREWYAEIFGSAFVEALAPHHIQAIEWHWNARTNLAGGVAPDFLAYFSIWARGNMKTTIARRLVIADAALSIGNGGGYALIVGGTTKKVRGTAKSIESMLTDERIKRYYPELAQVKRNEAGASKGWTADFINTKAGYVFHFIGLDEGVAGANVDDIRPSLIIPDDIDDREDSAVVSESRFQTFTRAVLPTRQGNTLVFFAQNLISRYSVMYRIYKQQARVLTNRLMTEPIPAVLNLETETRTVNGIVKDIVVNGETTWHKWDLARVQDEIDTYGLAAFNRECQHEVEQTKEGLMLKNYDDDVHVISESEFAAQYGSLSAWQNWSKWNYNDWSRTKTDKHANVAGYITVSSQNTRLPGFTFMFFPMSFPANTEAEDVAERLLSVLSPFAYQNTTWAQLRKDVLLRANAAQHTTSFKERTEYERSHLAKVIPTYARPLLQKWNVRRGVMSHSEDTIRQIYNSVFGFNFSPSNPKRFDALEDIDRDLKVDFSTPHPFRPNQLGFTRWFIVAPDDRADPLPRIVNNQKVYRPVPYNDALQPHELYDWDLLRYQLKNWRIKDTVLTSSGESDDAPLKLNDDFGQSLQMVYHKKLVQNVPLSDGELFEAKLREEQPELAPEAIHADPNPASRVQKWAARVSEQNKDEEKRKRNFDQSDDFARIFYEQGLEDDMSWINNL